MRYAALAVGLVAATSAQAQEVTGAEALVLPRLIDSLCVDLVEDRNGCETAVLLASADNPDTADLIIFSDRRARAEQEVLSVARDIVFNGPIFGQAPSLERAEDGSLLVHAEQIGIGRSPWIETLTLDFRDGDFVVAGRSYMTYDRILGGSFTCDVNLVTGDWTSAAERPDTEGDGTLIYQSSLSGRVGDARILVTDWHWTVPLPAPCSAEMAAWWSVEPE